MKYSQSLRYSITVLLASLCLSACQAPTTTPEPTQKPQAKATPKPTRPAATATPKPTPLTTAKRFDESERRYIFRLIVEAEDQAHADAEAKYPVNLSNPSVSVEMAETNTEPNMKMADELVEKYKAKVYKQFRLTKKERELIENEGLMNHWPPL